jgi:hypothetical protein
MTPEGPPTRYEDQALPSSITAAETGGTAGMKKLLEILVCFVHPFAVVPDRADRAVHLHLYRRRPLVS